MSRHLFMPLLAAASLCAIRFSAEPTFASEGGGGGSPDDGASQVDPAAATADAAADAPGADAAKAKPAPTRARAAAPADDGLVEAEVRRGTVVVGDGQPVGPGGKVRLSAEEVAKLRLDGVLVDPETAPAPAFDGPVISQA